MRANVDAHRALGSTRRSSRRPTIARLAPGLALDDDEVAAWEPGSGYADPSVTAAGFMRAATRDRAHGWSRAPRSRRSRSVDGGPGHRRRDDGRRVAAPVVVNAAGAWAAGVGAMVGLDVPRHGLAPRHGLPRRARAAPRPIPVVIDNARSMYFRPEGGELVLVGLEDGNQIGGSPDRDTATAAPGVPRSSPRTGSCAACPGSPTARSAPPTAARTA